MVLRTFFLSRHLIIALVVGFAVLVVDQRGKAVQALRDQLAATELQLDRERIAAKEFQRKQAVANAAVAMANAAAEIAEQQVTLNLEVIQDYERQLQEKPENPHVQTPQTKTPKPHNDCLLNDADVKRLQQIK